MAVLQVQSPRSRRKGSGDSPTTGVGRPWGGGLEACRSERTGSGREGDEVGETGSLGAVREDARGTLGTCVVVKVLA